LNWSRVSLSYALLNTKLDIPVLDIPVWVDSESQTRELNQHRTKTVENEAEMERLKRQLISERFERYTTPHVLLYYMLECVLS